MRPIHESVTSAAQSLGMMAEANLVTEEYRPAPKKGDHFLQVLIRDVAQMKMQVKTRMMGTGSEQYEPLMKLLSQVQADIRDMGSQYLSESEVTSANVEALYDGHADVSPIVGKGGQAAKAFNVTPETTWVRTDRLITHKNQNDDPKYKAGMKVHPCTTAAKFMGKVIDGKHPKKRDPIKVMNNGDGTYDVLDGNATTQAAMMADWQKLPVEVVQDFPPEG